MCVVAAGDGWLRHACAHVRSRTPPTNIHTGCLLGLLMQNCYYKGIARYMCQVSENKGDAGRIGALKLDWAPPRLRSDSQGDCKCGV